MTMYIVLGREGIWEGDVYVVGIYSTKEKAQAIMDGPAREKFPNDMIWIEENEVDIFTGVRNTH